MKLFDILQNTPYELIQGGDTDIKSLTIDSRRVGRGSLFFCIKGLKADGHSFVPDVVRQHVAAIVAEDDVVAPNGVTVVKVGNTRETLSCAAANFYGRPADEMTLIGVTGTNGKTSTTYFMESVLNAGGNTVGVIGTVEFRVGGEKLRIHTATSTTPDAIELQQIFRRMRERQADSVIMEVTSHALHLRKVDGIKYKVGIFTNLTQDHLDFHGTMEAYCEAKARLFKMCEFSVINADDPSAGYISRCCADKVLTFGINSDCDLRAEDVELRDNGCYFSINIKGNREHFFIPVRGRFSVYNCLGVIGAALCLGVSVADIRAGLANFSGVPGRIQSVNNNFGFNVVVDYAHTPDGLRNIISAVREITRNSVITVFGCGGDRDRAKRPIMGRIAGELSDYCVLTSDNPRTEVPEEIIIEIETGIRQTKCVYEKQADRRKAIRRAIELAVPGDSVIIAGKGHENYQIFADRTLHFDDREEAAEALSKLKIPTHNLTLREVAFAIGAESEGIGNILISEVSIDSRRIKRGGLFIAIKGENFDGHDFIENAFKAGAAACVVEHGKEYTGKTSGSGFSAGETIEVRCPILRVGSTAKALLDLSESHRRKFNVPVVAVTGSSGKTTTKDMIASVLTQKYNTLCTIANKNNEIGMPLTLLRLTSRHECAVLEMGMNHFGVISRMSKAARPDICIITNIGMAHAGHLSGRGGVLRAKCEIFDYINPNGLAILNGDDNMLAEISLPCERLYYGFSKNCEIRGINLRENAPDGSRLDVYFAGRSFEIIIPRPGKHMAYNALAAVAAGMRLGLSILQIQRGISEFTPSENRMDNFNSPWGIAVMNDSYNANPESMAAALDVLAASKGPKAAILADMKELGEFSEHEHRKLGRYASEIGIDMIIFVGQLSSGAYNEALGLKREGVFHFKDNEALKPKLRELLKPCSTVLIKGSRSMKLDEIADMMRGVYHVI